MDATAALRYLAASPIFADAEPGELEELLEACTIRRVPAGRSFVKEGAAGDSAHFILSGRAEVTKIGSSGESHRLSEVEAGALLGEIGLLTPHPRSATVTATEDLVCLELPREGFLALLDAHSTAARKLLRHVATSLAERMRAMNERLVDLFEHEHLREGPPDFEHLQARLRQALLRQI